jgi:hypothetical protein
VPSEDKNERDHRQQKLDAARQRHLRRHHVQPAARVIDAVHCDGDQEDDSGHPQLLLGRSSVASD